MHIYASQCGEDAQGTGPGVRLPIIASLLLSTGARGGAT